MKLEKQAEKEIKSQEKETLSRLKKDYATAHEAVQKNWYYRQLLSKKQLENINTISEKELKNILKMAIAKYYEKELKSALKKIEAIKSNDFNFCQWGVCSIDWVNNRTWGYCPRGEYRNGHDHKEYRSVTGCGYDKLSTLTADMFNEDMFLRSYIANYIEKHAINKDNIREKLGYGIRIINGRPHFDGGVGVSCHIAILKKLGFKVVHNETKRSDYIEFERK